MSETTFETFIGFNSNEKRLVHVNDDFVRGICSSIADEKGLPSLDFWKDTPVATGLLTGPAHSSTKEDDISQAMASELDKRVKAQASESIAGVQQSLPPVETKWSRNGHLDVIKGSSNQVLAFVEVGLVKKYTQSQSTCQKLDEMFWKKVHQADNYLQHLYRNGAQVKTEKGELQVPHDGGTILFAVIVFDRNKTMGRMAIFTAERKGQGDYRVALMWRCESPVNDGIESIADAYGAFINAVVHIANAKASRGNKWQYLGPNCTKVINNKRVRWQHGC